MVNCIVVSLVNCNLSILPFNLDAQFTFCNASPIDTCTRLIWIRNQSAFTDEEIDALESCCLLQSCSLYYVNCDPPTELPILIENITMSRINIDIDQVINDNNDKKSMCLLDTKSSTICFHTFEAISSTCYSNCTSDLNKMPSGTKVALAHCSKLNKHQMIQLAKQYSAAGIKIVALTHLFENCNAENVFTSTDLFLEHMERMIEFARIAGAQHVVYKDESSKRLSISRKQVEFLSYVTAHDIFVSVFKRLAEYAAKKNVTIVIEHTPGNYLFQEDHVHGMVETIECPNVVCEIDCCILEHEFQFLNPLDVIAFLLK